MNINSGSRFIKIIVLISLFLQSLLLYSEPRGKTENEISVEFIQSLSLDEQVWLKEHPVIRVVQDPGWPPVEFSSENGEPTGMSDDYLKLVEKKLGIRFERIKSLTWLEAYDSLMRGEADMTTSVAVTPKREEFLAFTKPYLSIPIVIAAQMDVTYIADFDELKGKKVAVVKNYAIDDWISQDFPDIDLFRVNTTLEGLQMLQRGEVFVFIDNLLIIGYYQAMLAVSSVKIAGQTPYVNNQCMAVRKDWATLAGILQKALETVSEEERIDIYRKWLPVRYEHGFNYPLFRRVVFVFVFLLLLMAVWNWSLVRQIRARKAAETEKERLLLAIEQANEIIAISSADGIIRYINPAFERITGYARGEETGRNPVKFKSDFHESGFYQRLSETIITGNPWKGRITNKSKDGTFYTLESSISPIMDNSGKIIYFICILRDITGELELENRVAQSQKMEAIGFLAGGIAHDFNNLLFPIIGRSEMLLEDLPAGSLNFRNAEEIITAARRAGDLVNQILSFSRQSDHMKTPVMIQQIVKEVIRLTRATIPSNIEIEHEIQDDCAPVMADPTQMHQIVMNLITNAFHAVEKTGGKISVRLIQGKGRNNGNKDNIFQSDKFSCLSVTDTGPGIPPEIMGKIFEPYFTTKERGKGTGLGLSVVYGIVKDHGGEISLDSDTTGGTTFNVYLPVDESGLIYKKTEKDSGNPAGVERILVVDDEISIVRLEKQLLESLGYTVEAFSDSVEALKFFHSRSEEIDLVITDMAMPGMTGDKLAVELLSIKPSAAIIICTGYNENMTQEKAASLGISALLRKPVSKADMAHFIRRVLDRKNNNRLF